MAGKKYTGPERRVVENTRRVRDVKHMPVAGSSHAVRLLQRQRLSGETSAQTRYYTAGHIDVINSVSGPGGVGGQDRGIVEVKEATPHNEKRIGGAGRRSGDLARALKTGEPAYFDLAKTPKSVFSGKLAKLAKKAAKRIPAIGVAAGIYDLVNRSKQ